MEDEERQRLRELLRAHQSRLQVLELQQAQQGLHTPPQVITELADIRREIARVEAQLGRRIPTVGRAVLRQLRQQALAAFYAKEWERAEELLDQVAQADPGDEDTQAKLAEAQRQLDLRAFYQAICDLRDAGNGRAVLDALTDLEERQPGYPDTQGLRIWAEKQRQEKGHSVADMDQETPIHSPDVSFQAAELSSQLFVEGLPVDILDAIAEQQELLRNTRQQLFETVNLSPKPFAMLLARELIRFQQEKIRQIKDTLRSLGVMAEDLPTDERPSETDLFILTMLLGVSIGIPALFIMAAILSGVTRTVAPLFGMSTEVPIVPPTAVQASSSPTFTVISTLDLPTVQSGGAQFRVTNTGAEGLFLRSDHSTNGTPLKTLSDGTIVTIIGEDFSGPDTIWKRVRDPSGTDGWVKSEFLQAVQ